MGFPELSHFSRGISQWYIPNPALEKMSIMSGVLCLKNLPNLPPKHQKILIMKNVTLTQIKSLAYPLPKGSFWIWLCVDVNN